MTASSKFARLFECFPLGVRARQFFHERDVAFGHFQVHGRQFDLARTRMLASPDRMLFQSRQALGLDEEANGAALPRSFFDEAVALQGLDHLVNRGRGDLEVALQVQL